MKAVWDLETVEILLKKGAKIKTKDNQGKTALDLAIQKNNTAVIQLLKQASQTKK